MLEITVEHPLYKLVKSCDNYEHGLASSYDEATLAPLYVKRYNGYAELHYDVYLTPDIFLFRIIENLVTDGLWENPRTTIYLKTEKPSSFSYTRVPGQFDNLK